MRIKNFIEIRPDNFLKNSSHPPQAKMTNESPSSAACHTDKYFKQIFLSFLNHIHKDITSHTCVWNIFRNFFKEISFIYERVKKEKFSFAHFSDEENEEKIFPFIHTFERDEGCHELFFERKTRKSDNVAFSFPIFKSVP